MVRGWGSEGADALRSTRRRLAGFALTAAGPTFSAGIAVVPLLVVTFALTAGLTSPASVRELGDRLVELLPGQLGAPAAVDRLVSAGTTQALDERLPRPANRGGR